MQRLLEFVLLVFIVNIFAGSNALRLIGRHKDRNIRSINDEEGPLFGNGRETRFSDKQWWRSRVITGIRISCMESKYFTGVRVQYGEDWAPPHGFPEDPSCNSYSLTWLNYTLASDERITSVNMTYGMTDYGPDKIVHTFAVFTNKRALEPCQVDNTHLRHEKSTVSSGTKLEYISSYSGCSVYGIKLHW